VSKLRMPDLNKVILAGRLGRDADAIETDNGDGYKFGLAVSRRVKRCDEWQDDTTWLDCVYWPRSDADANRVDALLRKGRALVVEGGIRVREYEDKQHNKRKAYQILCFNLQPLDAREPKDELTDAPGGEPEAAPGTVVEDGATYDEDIPF